MKVKTKKRLFLFAFVYLFVLYLGIANNFGTKTQAFNQTIKGIEYNNANRVIESKKIKLHGKLSNYITGLSRFQGEITYEDRSYTVDISLKSGENAYIVDEDNYTGANATLGYLYSNEDLSQVTLYIFEYDASYHKGWNGETGLIFSGPARTKKEAQSITDKIAE